MVVLGFDGYSKLVDEPKEIDDYDGIDEEKPIYLNSIYVDSHREPYWGSREMSP